VNFCFASHSLNSLHSLVQYPCVIITGKGQPDVATRLFLKMVKTALNIPILGLFDSDPHGLKVLCSLFVSLSLFVCFLGKALSRVFFSSRRFSLCT
jgi:hypothetical protein